MLFNEIQLNELMIREVHIKSTRMFLPRNPIKPVRRNFWNELLLWTGTRLINLGTFLTRHATADFSLSFHRS